MICVLCQQQPAFHPTSCLNELICPLGVPEVDKALAWSWLIDLGQGDFAAARLASEVALTRERTIHTLFARAVVHLLQGEFLITCLLLEEALASGIALSGRNYACAPGEPL